MTRRATAPAAAGLLLALTLSACTDNAPTDAAGDGGATGSTAPGQLTVDSSADACTVSGGEAPAGRIAFRVTNTGSEVTEFYLLGEDGLRIVGEVENISPGLTRDLVLQAAPGKYFTACKPGMVGDGIRSAFTVTGDQAGFAFDAADSELVDQATQQYGAYVRDQTEQLLSDTQDFAELYKAGKDDEARALYPEARLHWERIETVAESFGDLDPSMDLREADLEPDQEWTGWHAIEKDLWPPADGYTPLTEAERATLADKLVTDTQELYDRTRDMPFTVDQIGNGSKGLLDEVATGKVTGEEEAWSHTDLWDFQGNVDGARVGFEGLLPLLEKKDPALAKTVQTEFDDLQKLLDEHKDGDGFVLYTDLTDAEIKALSDGVNALSEPLSKVTAAVLQ